MTPTIKKIILFHVLFVPLYSSGQYILSSTQGILQSNSTHVEYCVGEIAVNTLLNDKIFTIGYLQPVVKSIPNSVSPEINIIVYDFISPDNDGKNDTFYIDGLSMHSDNEVVVVDKNGKIVFNTKNYKNDWQPSELAPGHYFYIIKILSKKWEAKGGLLIQ